MGEVSVILRVMPEGADVDLGRIERDVRACVDVRKLEREPIAFGLTALRVLTVVPDAAGGTDEVEKKISSIEGVRSVEVIDVRRLL